MEQLQEGFVQCEVRSDEFDEVLEEGYEVFTWADKLAIPDGPSKDHPNDQLQSPDGTVLLSALP